MKKIVLSMAGVLAATAFAPEASAVPAFARQVGMACSACHQQHFPVLNAFGRAFKAGGYTMMGAQGKVEGEHLSIPDTLNASFIMKLRWQKDNTAGVTGSKTSGTQALGDGELQFFDEFAMFLGGRIAENVGFALEGQVIDPTAPFTAGFKMPFTFDVGAAKLSVIPFRTDALGPQFGYELSSGGVMRANRWSEHRRETSAIQYLANDGGGKGAATGFAFVAQNELGFVNVTKYASNLGGGSTLGSTYLRAAATPNVAGWAMVAGVGVMTGQSFNATGSGAKLKTEQTFVDFQAHGEVAGKELGVYAQYAAAPAGDGFVNAYNGSVCAVGTACNPDKTAFTIGADYTVIPHVLSLGAAYRMGESGAASNVNGDDAVTVQAVYDLYQNVAFHAVFSSYSGTKYDAAPTAATNLTTLMLEAAW